MLIKTINTEKLVTYIYDTRDRMGEAAGAAAAMSSDFANMNVAELQAHLESQGVKIRNFLKNNQEN